MRYLQLFEVDAQTGEYTTTPYGTVPVENWNKYRRQTNTVAPAVPTKVYYHITTKRRLKSIQANGIEPNHPRRWKTGTGRQLGQRGNIYVISDFRAAVHWANKIQWERYNGKEPEPSPYVIVCVRENPKTLEPDPNPENGLYGKSFFQKSGKIEPHDIMKIIPLTRALVKSMSDDDGDAKITEDGVSGFGHNYSLRKCVQTLRSRGWEPTTTPGEFHNIEYPEYSIDLDINSALGGPFQVFKGDRRIAVTRTPPVAQHLALKDRLI